MLVLYTHISETVINVLEVKLTKKSLNTFKVDKLHLTLCFKGQTTYKVGSLSSLTGYQINGCLHQVFTSGIQTSCVISKVTLVNA